MKFFSLVKSVSNDKVMVLPEPCSLYSRRCRPTVISYRVTTFTELNVKTWCIVVKCEALTTTVGLADFECLD